MVITVSVWPDERTRHEIDGRVLYQQNATVIDTWRWIDGLVYLAQGVVEASKLSLEKIRSRNSAQTLANDGMGAQVTGKQILEDGW